MLLGGDDAPRRSEGSCGFEGAASQARYHQISNAIAATRHSVWVTWGYKLRQAKRLFHNLLLEKMQSANAKCHSRKILENAARHLESSSAFDPRFSINILLSLLCLFIYPRMIRTALRSTTSFASTSFARPVVARGIARPVLAQAPAQAKRGYHEKVIDHYENPRNVSSLCRRPGTAPSGPVLPMEVPRGIHD